MVNFGGRDLSQNRQKENSPMFIYKILHGEKAPFMPGEAGHETKFWNGIYVDKHIPDLALNELSKIENIEVRSSCHGESPERPTFLVFRPTFLEEERYIKSVVARLNRFKDITAGWDYGAKGKPRIGITHNLWYAPENQKIFVQWWLSLPIKIKRSL